MLKACRCKRQKLTVGVPKTQRYGFDGRLLGAGDRAPNEHETDFTFTQLLPLKRVKMEPEEKEMSPRLSPIHPPLTSQRIEVTQPRIEVVSPPSKVSDLTI